MTEPVASMEEVARQVRMALATADLSAFGHLLDPAVRWGPPGDPSPPCQSRKQVLTWYARGRDKRARADVTDVEITGDHILVGMVVTGLDAVRSTRWQILTVTDGLITNIVGFEQRSEALAHLTGRAPGSD